MTSMELSNASLLVMALIPTVSPILAGMVSITGLGSGCVLGRWLADAGTNPGEQLK